MIRSTPESRQYHLEECAIALKPDDPRHILPSVPPTARRILDVGCGAGQTLLALKPSDNAFDAVGIDPDIDALALGRELTSSISFTCGIGESLPFHDESFDFVISRVAIPYMNIPTALAEISRVLEPDGGIWMVLQPFKLLFKQLERAVRLRRPKSAAYQLYSLANGILLHSAGRLLPWPLTGAYESFQTTHGISKALRATGFVSVAVSRGHHFVVTARKGGKAKSGQ